MLKLFGDRVAIVEVDVEFTGSVVLPQGYNPMGKEFFLGKVVQVGDGTDGMGKVEPMLFSEGQYVAFQIPPHIRKTASYRDPNLYDGKTVQLIHQHDIIGVLDSPTINRNTFRIAGNWILLKLFTNRMKSSLIEIPPTVNTEIEDFRVRAFQIGNGVTDTRYTQGQEIYVEKSKCTPILIEDEEFAFVDKRFVYGVNSEESSIMSSIERSVEI